MTIINKYFWHFNELKNCSSSSNSAQRCLPRRGREKQMDGLRGVGLGFGPAALPIRLHLYLSGVVNIIQISTAGTKIYFCSTFSPLFFWRLQRGLQFPHFYCKLIMHTLRNLHSACVRGVRVCVCVCGAYGHVNCVSVSRWTTT